MKFPLLLLLASFLIVNFGCGASVSPDVADGPTTVDEPAPAHEPP
jgi:hypothetical protein